MRRAIDLLPRSRAAAWGWPMTESDPTKGIRLLLNVTETCKAIGGVCPKTLWNYTHPRGTLRAVKIGCRTMYDIEDLRRWIAEQKEKGNDDE